MLLSSLIIFLNRTTCVFIHTQATRVQDIYVHDVAIYRQIQPITKRLHLLCFRLFFLSFFLNCDEKIKKCLG